MCVSCSIKNSLDGSRRISQAPKSGTTPRLLTYGTLGGATTRGKMPNKRLKLPGDERSKGSGVFAPWRARTVVQHPCGGGRVARSLSAIR